jgi:serine/threonine protein kinase
MEPRIELSIAPFSGLIQLQNALNDLEDIAGAFQVWTGDPGLLPIDLLTGRGVGESKQLELIEGLAELLRQRSESSRTSEFWSLDGLTSRAESDSVSREVGPRFQIVRHHAEGGLGKVSVAIDRELKREVALKEILERHADDPARRDRFLIEAEITGGLEHPGIVPVYSLGHSADGRPFYAMRLIRGETLADAIARFHKERSGAEPGGWGLELRKLLRRFIDVCNAIEYAHGRGILHRDLKPSNVMLGKHGETLVVDWGLAKPIGPGDSDEDDEGPLLPFSGGSQTLPGSAIGTPSFMSPEQAGGRRGSIGARSDVYSLGATLYCLLTGRAPFVSTEPGRILQDVQEGNFPRPRQVNPRVPRPLEAICLKAMAVDPNNRYGSTRELAEDIERWNADEPVSALQEPLNQRLGRWTRRKRTTVTACLAGLVVAIVALGVILTLQANANHELRRANDLARLINSSLLDANRRVAKTNEELKAASLRERARLDLALDAIRSFHAGVSDDLLLRETEFAGLRSRLLRGAIEFYGKLERQFDNFDDRSSREAVARIYGQVAALEATLGPGGEILAAHRKALTLRRKLAKETPQDLEARSEVASALISLGMMVRNFENREAGMKHIEEARSILQEITQTRPIERKFQSLLVQAELEIGQTLTWMDRKPEALATYERALKLQRQLADKEASSLADQDRLATLTRNKGVLQIFLRRDQEALHTLSDCRDILSQLIGADPGNARFQFELSNVLKDIGDLWTWTGKRDVALNIHRQSLQIRESLSAALPSSVGYRITIAYSLMAIGDLCAMTGRTSEAIESYRRSAALQENQTGSPVGCYNLAYTLMNLSYCLEGAQRSIEADRAARIFRKAFAVGFRDVQTLKALAKIRPNLSDSLEFRLLIRDLDFPENPFAVPPGPDDPRVHSR